MTTTSLPDRLRALADLIDRYNLPEPTYACVSGVPSAIQVDDHDAVCSWSEALGVPIRVQHVQGKSTFTAYVVDHETWSVAFHDMNVRVPV